MMKINCFSVTFWFNIYEEHNQLLEFLQKEFKEEYPKFNIYNYTNNLLNPIITAINHEKKTNISISQINLRYNMDKVSFKDFDFFQEKTLKLFEILTENNVTVLHASIYINAELMQENALEIISKNTIVPTLYNEDIVDMTLKIGKKHEDLFYKIVTILNKKQMKLPKKVDEKGRLIPLPLISWNNSFVENEIIDISYEINDKYLYDFTKNYQTTEFYLNKMLFVLKDSFDDDVHSIIEHGKF